MCKLLELIEQHCPDGVVYKTLGELGCLYGGLTGKTKNDFGAGAAFVQYTTVYNNAAVVYDDLGRVAVGDREKQNAIQVGDVLITVSSENREDCGMTSVVVEEPPEICYLNSFCTGWRPNDNALSPAFLKHLLRGENVRKQIRKCCSGVTRFNLSKPKLLRVEVPVPPIEVQREIVRLLDAYVAVHDALVAKLNEEIEMTSRRENVLLHNILHAKRDRVVTLPDVSSNLDCIRKPVTKSSREPGPYPYYGASGIVDYVNGYLFDGEYLLIAEDGANLTARSTPIAFVAKGKTWVNNHAHILEFSDRRVQRYVELYLNATDISEFVTGATQPKLNQKNLNRIAIPLPDEDELDGIIAFLNEVQESHHQLAEELGREMELHVARLAEFRNQLLTFPEKVA